MANLRHRKCSPYSGTSTSNKPLCSLVFTRGHVIIYRGIHLSHKSYINEPGSNIFLSVTHTNSMHTNTYIWKIFCCSKPLPSYTAGPLQSPLTTQVYCMSLQNVLLLTADGNSCSANTTFLGIFADAEILAVLKDLYKNSGFVCVSADGSWRVGGSWGGSVPVYVCECTLQLVVSLHKRATPYY